MKRTKPQNYFKKTNKMKGSILMLAISLLHLGCTSDNDMQYKSEENKTKKVESENPVGIQNVNGNIPDTTNTIDISIPDESNSTKHKRQEKENESGASFAR